MAGKHLIFIHGRSTKPARDVEARLLRRALAGGLARIDPIAAERVETGRMKLSIAYYGDVSNRILVAARPKVKSELVATDGGWYAPAGEIETALARLLARPIERYTKEEYNRLPRNRQMPRSIARALSPVLSASGLGGWVLAAMYPDMKAYMTTHVTSAEIRDRLEVPLQKALLAGDDVALVAHSMGCIVAYDVLWKFSRLVQYRELRENRVSLWLTLGSPLGDPIVRGTLMDSREAPEYRYPANVDAWINVSALDDFVAHDGDVKDDFQEMLDRRFVKTIDDLVGIRTFYIGKHGANPHKEFGYLVHPVVARIIAAWLWT